MLENELIQNHREEWRKLTGFQTSMKQLMQYRHQREKQLLVGDGMRNELVRRHSREVAELRQANELAIALLREEQKQQRAALINQRYV